MTRLLDSVILIDHFNGVEDATSYIARVHRGACLSVITRAEVLVGFDEAAAALARRVLDRFPTLPISWDDADAAAALRRLFR